MKNLYPSQVTLDQDEVSRINRVRVARYLSITPAQVDALPACDLDDVMAVMWADEEDYKRKAGK